MINELTVSEMYLSSTLTSHYKNKQTQKTKVVYTLNSDVNWKTQAMKIWGQKQKKGQAQLPTHNK